MVVVCVIHIDGLISNMLVVFDDMASLLESQLRSPELLVDEHRIDIASTILLLFLAVVSILNGLDESKHLTLLQLNILKDEVQDEVVVPIARGEPCLVQVRWDVHCLSLLELQQQSLLLKPNFEQFQPQIETGAWEER